MHFIEPILIAMNWLQRTRDTGNRENCNQCYQANVRL